MNTYNRGLEQLKGDSMFDLEHQIDLARSCVFEIDEVLSRWRIWRKLVRDVQFNR